MVNDVNKFIMPNGDEIKIDGLYGKITNCLLEVPQRIKLELNDGVLTLKAGSVVIVPNGFEADGTTPKFDYVTVESDLTTIGWATLTGMVFTKSNERLDFTANAQITSGNSATLSGGNVWYDTVTNTVKRCNDGSTWTSGYSFPICLATSNGSSTTSESPFSSINQTFNGMGYIGSTVWVDKGVKGLIPNGRNEDGTLKNIEYTTDKIFVHTESSSVTVDNSTFALMPFNPDYDFFRGSTAGWEISDNNQLIHLGDGSITKGFLITTLAIKNGNITRFTPKLPFRAVDWNDFSNTPHIINTYVNGASGYRIWSDGYCEQWGRTGNKTSVAITLTKKMSDTNYNIQITVINSNGDQNWAATNITVNGFTILDSENKEHSWKVSGYLAEGEY